MLNTRTTLTSSPPGERVDGDDIEMIDLVAEEEDAQEEEAVEEEEVEEEEVEEEEVEEEEASEDEDEVTETNDPRSEEGKEPVFHHEIYDRLVNLMSSQGAYSKSFFLFSIFPLFLFLFSGYIQGYADHTIAHEAPDHGIDSMDITSFHPDQRDWGSSRAHWPTILTLWAEPPGPRPTYRIGYLLFNGQLILDYAGTPMRAFRNLPLTISSAVKGFRLEAWMRQDIKRLRVHDILARLRTWNTPNGRVPLHKAGDFTDRVHFFRIKAGLVTFRPQNFAPRVAARNYMDSLRTPAQRASNLAIDQDLTPDQLATLKAINRGGRINAVAGPGAGAPAPARAPANVPVPAPARVPARVSARIPAPAPTPSPTVTPPSRSDQRRRQHAALQPATPPTPAPVQNLPDSRDAVPETCKESYTLNNALEETVQHFKRLTGQPPKQINTAQSYSTQWNALQAQFERIWKSQRPAEEIPQLFKLCKWTGGISCWNDDWRTKVGGEERDREGKRFGEYMDATNEGGPYLDLDGGWRSVRDTWCNSHVNPAWIQARQNRRLRPIRAPDHSLDQRDSTGQDRAEEVPRNGSAGDSEARSGKGYDKSFVESSVESPDENFEEYFEEDDPGDDDYRD